MDFWGFRTTSLNPDSAEYYFQVMALRMWKHDMWCPLLCPLPQVLHVYPHTIQMHNKHALYKSITTLLQCFPFLRFSLTDCWRRLLIRLSDAYFSHFRHHSCTVSVKRLLGPNGVTSHSLDIHVTYGMAFLFPAGLSYGASGTAWAVVCYGAFHLWLTNTCAVLWRRSEGHD